jgi:hypothetical protein
MKYNKYKISSVFKVETDINTSIATSLVGLLTCDIYPQSKLERKSKTEKREFLDPQVINITPGRHKQKGLNLLFFNFLTSAWSLASW